MFFGHIFYFEDIIGSLKNSAKTPEPFTHLSPVVASHYTVAQYGNQEMTLIGWCYVDDSLHSVFTNFCMHSFSSIL